MTSASGERKKVERERRKEGMVKGAGKVGGIKTDKEKIKAGEQSRGDMVRNRRRKRRDGEVVAGDSKVDE